MAPQLFVKLVYNGALGKQYSKTSVTAISALDDSASIQGTLASFLMVEVKPLYLPMAEMLLRNKALWI